MDEKLSKTTIGEIFKILQQKLFALFTHWLVKLIVVIFSYIFIFATGYVTKYGNILGVVYANETRITAIEAAIPNLATKQDVISLESNLTGEFNELEKDLKDQFKLVVDLIK